MSTNPIASITLRATTGGLRRVRLDVSDHHPTTLPERVAVGQGLRPKTNRLRRVAPSRNAAACEHCSELSRVAAGAAAPPRGRLRLGSAGRGGRTRIRAPHRKGVLALSRQHRTYVDSIARLAGEAGYADQPHSTRECVRLAEQTPRALLREIREGCSSNHDHDASYSELRPALLTARLASGRRRHGS